MDGLKSFVVGVGTVIAFVWVIFAAIWGLGFIFSLGQIWADTWLWLNIVALVPYGLLAVGLLVLLGEAMRKG